MRIDTRRRRRGAGARDVFYDHRDRYQKSLWEKKNQRYYCKLYELAAVPTPRKTPLRARARSLARRRLAAKIYRRSLAPPYKNRLVRSALCSSR